VEMQDRVGALGTAVDDAVDHDLPPECAKMLPDIVFRTHLDVFCRALLGYLPACVEPMTVRLQPGARAVWAKPRASPIGAPTSKAVAQRLQGWRVFLGQFPYTIVHIPGDENCWGDLLSRWVTRPGGPVCVHASVKYTEVLFAGSDKFPTKEVVRGVQAAAAEGGPTRDTAMGVASRDSEGLYRVEHHGHRVIWVPAGADSLKKRLLVCAHLEGTGHRGVDATMARLERHCVWDRGKTLPHFTVGDYVLVARVSRQGKHRKLMSTWTGPWRVANDDKEHVYAVQHLVTAELRDVHVARMRFTPMTSSRSPASSARFSNNWRTRASTTSGASLLSSGLQAATSSLSRWPGKDWRRRRAPGSRCRACSMTRRPCCAKSSRRCG